MNRSSSFRRWAIVGSATLLALALTMTAGVAGAATQASPARVRAIGSGHLDLGQLGATSWREEFPRDLASLEAHLRDAGHDVRRQGAAPTKDVLLHGGGARVPGSE